MLPHQKVVTKNQTTYQKKKKNLLQGHLNNPKKKDLQNKQYTPQPSSTESHLNRNKTATHPPKKTALKQQLPTPQGSSYPPHRNTPKNHFENTTKKYQTAAASTQKTPADMLPAKQQTAAGRKLSYYHTYYHIKRPHPKKPKITFH